MTNYPDITINGKAYKVLEERTERIYSRYDKLTDMLGGGKMISPALVMFDDWPDAVNLGKMFFEIKISAEKHEIYYIGHFLFERLGQKWVGNVTGKHHENNTITISCYPIFPEPCE